MDPQTSQKVLIGLACVGLGAGAHFVFSGKPAPAPATQVAVTAPRERPHATVEKEPRKNRSTPVKATVVAPKERERAAQPTGSAKRDREKVTGSAAKKRQTPAC